MARLASALTRAAVGRPSAETQTADQFNIVGRHERAPGTNFLCFLCGRGRNQVWPRWASAIGSEIKQRSKPCPPMQAPQPVVADRQKAKPRHTQSTKDFEVMLAAETEHQRKQWVPDDQYEACFKHFFGPPDSVPSQE
ncbi:hypothetical protein pqer_cds_380 [Pandoravirus quercus]|uniref:Uncharacterized protein n=1 Tax=Pandoravirus quercus TaxID=2107709 RepID=A0A2U7U8T9_9VIRU|nr:hypothetical protein pqer_cds_380 [Pandoravirus quercus]AVK74802.1 hypothetical protein pqer_cds_380 [Pandoravirus quercus]